MKISIIGSGYVGLANAAIFSKNHSVHCCDIDEEKINMLKNSCLSISEVQLSNQLKINKKNIQYSNDFDICTEQSDYIFVCVGTNYSDNHGKFDTLSLENILEKLNNQPTNAIIVLKSTLPIGFCEKFTNKYTNLKIIYYPEFLRENTAYADILNSSRHVIGGEESNLNVFYKFLQDELDNPNIIKTNFTEAEAIKLFSNAFLAMRIAFFNELDTFAYAANLSASTVIKGVCADCRIGDWYNNPSFGYGGYCLPKDTKQLLYDFKDLPQSLIKASITSNNQRIKFISDSILNKSKGVIGIYRLVMKKGSDNIRESSIIKVLENLVKSNKEVIIYEPFISENKFKSCEIVDDLNYFKNKSDLIITNRYDDNLSNVIHKVFSRDLFRTN